MAAAKYTYEDFIKIVDPAELDFVNELHALFTERGAKIVVKESASGYLVSYQLNKKSIANYVFRKTGLISRIFAGHLDQYEDFLETLPESMIAAMQKAPNCRRLLNPNDCNPRCPMGYDYTLRGEHLQKCRNSAFMFLIDEETKPYIREFILKELDASRE